MKILNLKNLKKLKQECVVLKGNFGVTALINPNGSIANKFQIRIILDVLYGIFHKRLLDKLKKKQLEFLLYVYK